MAATNEQVQAWSNERTRTVAEIIRNLEIRLHDDRASIGDVYANLTDSPDWTDNRPDHPPNLLTPNDLLAIHTLVDNLWAILNGTLVGETAKATAVDQVANQMAIVSKACVRPATVI